MALNNVSLCQPHGGRHSSLFRPSSRPSHLPLADPPAVQMLAFLCANVFLTVCRRFSGFLSASHSHSCPSRAPPSILFIFLVFGGEWELYAPFLPTSSKHNGKLWSYGERARGARGQGDDVVLYTVVYMCLLHLYPSEFCLISLFHFRCFCSPVVRHYCCSCNSSSSYSVCFS